MKAKGLLITILLLGMILQTGCWNRRELNDLAIVSAIGIDKSSNKNEYLVTFQLVNAGAVASGVTGGTKKETVPAVVITGTGTTLFEAIRKTSQKSPRQLFFGHVRVIVFGESAAREGIGSLLEFFERSRETRLTSSILVARDGKAETVLATLTVIEPIPANAIAGRIKYSTKLWSENINVTIDEVIRGLESKVEDPVISGIKILGSPKAGSNLSTLRYAELLAIPKINGIGLFKEGKLIKWLDDEEARGTVWIKNKMKGAIVGLDCEGIEQGIAIEVIRSKTKVKAQVQNEKPLIQVSIREEGNIGELKCPMNLQNPEEIRKLEAKWADETKKEVMAAIRAAKKEKSDIFGFGEAVNRADPKQWKKMKATWNETFAECQVDVKVDAFIRRPGMQTNPYMYQEKK